MRDFTLKFYLRKRAMTNLLSSDPVPHVGEAAQEIFDQRFYRDLVIREYPKTIARRLLSGNVACRPFTLLPITGCAGDLFLRSVVYYHGETLQPFLLDTLDALLVHDRLVRLKKRQEIQNKPTERTEAALSFCKGAVNVLEDNYPKAHQYVTKALYPFVTAPSRTIASSSANTSLLKKGLDQT